MDNPVDNLTPEELKVVELSEKTFVQDILAEFDKRFRLYKDEDGKNQALPNYPKIKRFMRDTLIETSNYYGNRK